VPSRWTDLDRPPLVASRLNRALCQRGAGGSGMWREIRVVEETASTNADVRAAAESGAAEGVVVLAERQTGGRGRLDRQWESPARAGVLLSMLLRPTVAAARLPLLPLLTGVAVAEAVRAIAELPAMVKWPNDVLVDGRKLGGILVERTADGAVVVGVGVNVSTRPDELPVPTATSVQIAGGAPDRESLAKEILRAFERRYAAFIDTGGAPESVLPAYREVCETIGSEIVVQLPDGESAHGTAVRVDDGGMLVVRDGNGIERAWSAGDVIHVRAEG
jgi:BirA family transcriptional regulator, biotin operon repressor / biotin---[acetyl-CoA-carboxylase] ligase